jgi:hypothetical protein
MSEREQEFFTRAVGSLIGDCLKCVSYSMRGVGPETDI